MSRRKTSVVVRREGAGGGGWDEVSVFGRCGIVEDSGSVRREFEGRVR